MLFFFMLSFLGSRNKIDFWSDPWNGRGRLIETLGYERMLELGVENAKVSHFISENKWVLPVSANAEVNSVRSEIKEIEFPKLAYMEDTWTWTHSAIGNFTLKSAFQVLRVHHAELEWTKIVWSPLLFQSTVAVHIEHYWDDFSPRIDWANFR